MIIDHISIAVKSLHEGISHFKKVFGYDQYTEIVNNSRQKVNVVFLSKKDSLLLKLIEPSGPSSPIYNYAKRGGGLHHLCFKCDNIETELETLGELGLRILTQPQPGEAFENENISFLYAKHGLNIELIDTEKKAKIIKNLENEKP